MGAVVRYAAGVNDPGARGMIVAELPGAMPFACSAGVRPGIFLHGGDSRATVGHGEDRDSTRRSAAGDHFAASNRPDGRLWSNRSATACRAAARNCLDRQGDSLIRPRSGADTGDSASLRGAVE